MDEIHRCQESLDHSIHLENEKYSKLQRVYDLDSMISTAKDYHDKLVNIKRSMLIISDRSRKLKRKASKMLEDKQREDLEVQRSRERRERLEKHLEPVFNANNPEYKST